MKGGTIMNASELQEIILGGETSTVQFKEKLPHPDAFAAEMVAMANARGGVILLGVTDSGEVAGLSPEELREYGSQVANIATNRVIPVVYVLTEVVKVAEQRVLVVAVDEGINKPYKDNKLVIWLRQGPDKRKLSDNAEILRLFRSSDQFRPDELTIDRTTTDDVNLSFFYRFFEQEFDQPFDKSGLDLSQTLTNLTILKDGRLTLAGLLFFSKNPQQYRPIFHVKAVSFFGNEIEGRNYRNSKDINGTVPELYERSMDFLTSNLKHTQQGQNFNSTGILEVSKVALEELVQNALVHREYLKSAAIKILVFDNRIEIISPGRLPNSLTIEKIKYGNAVARNPLIATFCSKTMPYRGLGSGVKRAVKEQPNIIFINDVDGEQFTVIIPRPPEEYPS
jgi:predicted HTH transcriptional regulator